MFHGNKKNLITRITCDIDTRNIDGGGTQIKFSHYGISIGFWGANMFTV